MASTATYYDHPQDQDCTIKRYKWRRLQPTMFWKYYNREGEASGKSIRSLRYSMLTLLVMQRFTEPEIIRVIHGWAKHHGLTINRATLLDEIAAVKEYTAEERRRIKREEMRRYRAKKTQALACQPDKTRDRILAFLEWRDASPAETASALDLDRVKVKQCLRRMAKAGTVHKVGKGIYSTGNVLVGGDLLPQLTSGWPELTDSFIP